MLSDFQIGYIRRLLDRFLSFVPGPAPYARESIPAWCHQVCGVDTLGEVARCWGGCVRRLGHALLTYGLAEKVRQGRPSTASNLLLKDLRTIDQFAHAI